MMRAKMILLFKFNFSSLSVLTRLCHGFYFVIVIKRYGLWSLEGDWQNLMIPPPPPPQFIYPYLGMLLWWQEITPDGSISLKRFLYFPGVVTFLVAWLKHQSVILLPHF